MGWSTIWTIWTATQPKPTLHANIDKLPDRELSANLDRLLRFQRLFDNKQN